MTSNNYKLSILIIASLLATGCVPFYAAPQAGPKAKLGALNQEFFENQNGIFIYDDAIDCNHTYVLGNIRQRYKGEPVPISANKLTTILVQHFVFNYKPGFIGMTFYPHENQTYLITAANNRILTPEKDIKMSSEFSIVREVKNKNGKIEYIPVKFLDREVKNKSLDTVCVDVNLQKKMRIKDYSKLLY